MNIRNPKLLGPLFIAPFILLMEIINLRGKRYFVKFKEQTAGVFAIREKLETLYIYSLATASEYRRLGVATYILTYSEEMARKMNKKWLELGVLKTNTPALRLYKKLGFVKKEEKKRSLILRKTVKNH